MIDPAAISKITDNLYICAAAQTARLDELSVRNIRLIISMIGGRRPPENLAQPPYRLLWLPTFDTPLTPIPISLLMRGIQTALPVIHAGGSVLVFCHKGRHRSVAMGAAILIALGYSAHDAMQLIRAQRPVADPYRWHIHRQILKLERHWLHPMPTLGSQLHEAYNQSVTALLARLIEHLGILDGRR